MNKAYFIGNLTKAPETRTTQSGKQVCTFNIAVNRRGSNNEADFFHVQAWNGLADVCGRYLDKGRKVAVSGSVRLNTYTTAKGENRAEIVVTAEDVEFLSPYEKPAQNAPEAPKTDKQSGFVQIEEEPPF